MQSSYIFTNGIRMHYLRWSEPGARRPVLLLHGLASNAHIWELTAPHLAQAGLAPIALDLRGHGWSDKPDGDYSFDTYTGDLLAFLTAMDLEHAMLVGHSWGGMLALDFAARFQLGKPAPQSLVLVDGGMTQLDAAPNATWEDMRERLTPPPIAGMPLEEFLARLSDPNSRWQPDEQSMQIILGNFEVSTDETITPRLSFEHHMQIVRAMWEFPTYARFRLVRCPVLLVPASPPAPRTGMEDEYLDAKHAGIAIARQDVPRLTVHWMEDTIHDIPLQRPRELAELIVEFAR